MGTDEDATGGVSTRLGVCTACGRAYPLRVSEDGVARPVGTDGHCLCGNDGFDPISGD